MLSIVQRGTILSLALALPLMTGCGDDEPEQAETALPVTEQSAETQATEPPPEIASQAQQYGAAWNAEDPAAIAAFFTEDATVTAGDSTYTGRDQIEQRWAAPATPVLSDLEATESTFDHRGDEIIETGRFTYNATTEDGATVQVTGTYSHTWVQDADGIWRIRTADIQEDA